MSATVTTLSVLVQDNPGVLSRIAGLFARRGFNIQSLTVGQTEREDQSRITIVAYTPDETTTEQITKQLNKLVEVLKITEMEKGQSVRRELILVKVRADAANRTDVLSIVEMFRGKVVDVSPDSLTIEVTGKYSKIRAFRDMIAPYGVKELVQSGCVALSRGSRAITDRSKYDKTPKEKK